MEMKKIKDVQELLMEAITNFVIAEKAGEYCQSENCMGKVHEYFGVLGEYSRMDSPWHSVWAEVIYTC